jgi:hypothetical protein
MKKKIKTNYMSENNKHEKPEKDGIDWWEKLEAIVNSSVKGVVGGFVKNAHDRWQEFLRKAQKNLAGFFLLIVGFIFALVGISIIINELLKVSNGLGFALVGALALILGLVIIKK